MDLDLVRRALEFYSKSPDGQYDLRVVVPILEKWLEGAKFSLHGWSYEGCMNPDCVECYPEMDDDRASVSASVEGENKE